VLGDRRAEHAVRPELHVEDGSAAVALHPQPDAGADADVPVGEFVGGPQACPDANGEIVPVDGPNPEVSRASLHVRRLGQDLLRHIGGAVPAGDQRRVAEVDDRPRRGGVGRKGGLQHLDADPERLLPAAVVHRPLRRLRPGHDGLVRQVLDRRELPRAAVAETQAEVPAGLANTVDGRLVEVVGQAMLLIPPDDSEHVHRPGVCGGTANAKTPQGHRGIQGHVFRHPVFRLVQVLPTVAMPGAVERPPSHLRLEQVVHPREPGTADVLVLKRLPGAVCRVPGAGARMEPPIVMPPVAGLVETVAVELAEARPAHAVVGIPDAHALSPVEIEEVRLAGVVRAGDVVGQLVHQAAPGNGIKGQINLLEKLRLDAGRMVLALGAEGSARTLAEAVRLLAGDRRVLDQLGADAEHVGGAVVGEHGRVLVDRRFVDIQGVVGLAEIFGKGVGRQGD